MPIIDDEGRELNNEEYLLLFLPNSGTIRIVSNFSLESCDSMSKFRIVSTSSPKKSILYGYSEENEKTSRMLPLCAYCPGS